MAKTIKEKINDYIEKHPFPVNGSIEIFYSQAGTIHTKVLGDPKIAMSKHDSSNDRFHIYVGKVLYGTSYNFDKGLFEFAWIKMDIHKNSTTERRWEYCERYFIPKNEKQIYNKNGEKVDKLVMRYNDYDYTDLLSIPSVLIAMGKTVRIPNSFYKAFMKLTDNNPDLPPRYYTNDYLMRYPDILNVWLNCPKKTKKKKPSEIKLEQIIKERVLDSEELCVEILKQWFNSYANRYYTRKCCIVDDKNKCLRFFIIQTLRMAPYGITDAKEISRIYLDEKNKFLGCVMCENKIKISSSYNADYFHAIIINPEKIKEIFPYTDFYIDMIKEDIEKTKLNYHISFSNTSTVQEFNIFLKILKNKEIELLWKMGAKSLALQLAKCYEDPKKIMFKFLGEPVNNKGTISSRFGLTPEQILFHDRRTFRGVFNDRRTFRGVFNKIGALKRILGTNDLRSIDLDTFATYYDVIETMGWESEYLYDSPHLLRKLASYKEDISNVCALYSDAIQVYKQLSIEYIPDYNVNDFRNIEDLRRKHDDLVHLFNLQHQEENRLLAMRLEDRNKELEEKRKKIDKERKGYEYSDDDFLIRLPKTIGELVTEGSNLSHCVGSYTQEHADGKTTILFLRKVSDPEKSFYTIELSHGAIKQIHGFCNKWLGNNPEAIPFVMKWLKKIGVTCDPVILTNTSTGYNRGNAVCVPLPTV